MSQVTETIDVDVPVSVAYNQWTQFEDFPRFMDGVEEVRQLDDTHLHWVASIAGVKREWDATITDQIPDELVAWTNINGAVNRGVVTFDRIAPMSTRVTLALDFEPEGLVENVGDKLGFVKGQARSDLEHFREFITARGTATGAWRGEVHNDFSTDEQARPMRRPGSSSRPDDLYGGSTYADGRPLDEEF